MAAAWRCHPPTPSWTPLRASAYARATSVKLRTLSLLSLTPADAARLRRSPAALAEGLRRQSGRSSLGRYWHGVQYLLSGGAAEVGEPLVWLTGGGDLLGRNELGEVRYLPPAAVARLAEAFVDEIPDELGHGVYDEASMDEARIYPACWRRLAQTYDPLGTLRELYSYARTFLQECVRDEQGIVLLLEEEREDFDDADPDDADGEEGAAPPAGPPETTSSGETILSGDQGRRYSAASAAGPIPAELLARVDAELAALGYGPVGDFVMEPILAGGFVRSYVSADRTSAGFVMLSAERGVASTTFSSRLPGDALVQVSDAFLLEFRKVKFFGSTVSRGTPAQLHAALLERRGAIEKKLGPAVALAATLETTAALFELWWSKITKRK
jgi:Domain of unknown function (DUF1877)